MAWATALALLATGACGNGAGDSAPGEAPFSHESLDPVPLVGRVLSDAPELGVPFRVVATEEHLWVADGRGDLGLHVLDRATGAVVASVGPRGRAPAEFSEVPTRLVRDPTSEEGVWAFDAGLQRMSRFDAEPPGAFREAVSLYVPRLLRAVWLGPRRMISLTATEESRLTFLDARGRPVQRVRRDLPGPPDAPPEARLRAARAGPELCARPDGGAFVVTYLGFGRVEYFDARGRETAVGDVPFPSEPVFEAPEGGEGLRYREPDTYYTDCATTQAEVLLLFSGAGGSAPVRERIPGRWIHVLDWSGQLQGVYELDRPVGALAVSPDGARLYGTSYADAGVYVFERPDKGSTTGG